MAGLIGASGGRGMLLNRSSERDVLDRLLEDARAGPSGALVLRGDAGMGKTALLEYAVESGSDLRVLRGIGAESERELAYAGLHQLCAPVLDDLDGLPGPQRDALATTFGLRPGPVPDRFLVGLAVLSLLSAAAEQRPVLCVIDDAQWLDLASAQALAFVARRLLAESVVMLFAAREPGKDLQGLPELAVERLDDADARELLASVVPWPLDDRVRDQIIVETGGNPLALLELPRGLSSAQLAAGSGVLGVRSMSGRIEQSFVRRLRELPDATQRWLLVAAADPAGDPTVLWRAADLLGVARDAFEPGEKAGLVEVRASVRFRHPLVRSAIYGSAAPEARRQVHGALAEATDPEVDPDRRAWHLAEATATPDDNVAAELERSAGRAQARGGLAAAAAFLERAAQLSPEARQRASRRLHAARSYLAAGAPDVARRLIAQSKQRFEDAAMRAQAMRLEAAIRFLEGGGGDTPTLLYDAAMTIRDTDPVQARDILMEAFEAAMGAGRLAARTTMLDVARAARQTPPPHESQTVSSLLLSGYAERLTSGYANAVHWWRRATEASLTELEPHPWQGMVRNATVERFDFHSSVRISEQRLRLVREHGAFASLPVALNGVASCEMWRGRFGAAEALLAESETIAGAIGAGHSPERRGSRAHPHGVRVERLAVLCWRGREEEARRLAQAITDEALARGQGYAVGMVQWPLIVLELGHARYDRARIPAVNLFGEDVMPVGSVGLADVVEATPRSGDLDSAAAALARLSERAEACETPWALGLLARARALLATDSDAESHYRSAIDHLSRSAVVTDLARSRLLYGEWLRRSRRRFDARQQLRTALEMFSAMGAQAFAERAERELLATGERVRRRTVETRDELTAQEAQIARLACEGLSNQEIGARLFISQHTVAYHLRKIFSKLGITSRTQLHSALPEEPGEAATA